MHKRLLVLFLIFFTSQTFSAEVNIYSARKEELIKPLLDKFSEQTGIQINLVTGKADGLIKRLELEGKNSPADLLLTVDVGRLYRAQKANLLQPVDSEILNSVIPVNYRDPEGYWYGLSLRSRVIVYAKDKINPAELSTYEALTNPSWQESICVRSSSNIYNQSLVASLIANIGKEKTEQWASGLVANFARQPKGGDRDQIKAVSVGQCSLALVNTYYVAGMLNSSIKTEVAAAEQVAIFWPNQDGRGAHVNISGAGLTRSSENVNAAIELLEYLVSKEAQKWYADTNHEYPIRKNIEVSDTLKEFGEFKADSLELVSLGRYNTDAVRLMDRAGWK